MEHLRMARYGRSRHWVGGSDGQPDDADWINCPPHSITGPGSANSAASAECVSIPSRCVHRSRAVTQARETQTIGTPDSRQLFPLCREVISARSAWPWVIELGENERSGDDVADLGWLPNPHRPRTTGHGRPTQPRDHRAAPVRGHQHRRASHHARDTSRPLATYAIT
jgi:hypothetical protein